MKKRIFAFIISAIMILTSIPAANAGETGHAIIKDTVEIQRPLISSDNYFAIDNTLYNSSGDEIWTLESETEMIYTMTDECIITFYGLANGEIVEKIGFKCYGIDGESVTFKFEYDEYSFVYQYENSDYSFIIHADLLGMLDPEISITPDSPIPLYGYSIIDSRGEVIYHDDEGVKIATHISGDCFLEEGMTDFMADDEERFILDLSSDPAEKIPVDCNVREIMLGNLIVSKGDGLGVMNTKGEIIIPMEYVEIIESNGYYIAYGERVGEYKLEASHVYTTDGVEVFYDENWVQEYNGVTALIHSNGEYDVFTNTYWIEDIATGEKIVDAYIIMYEDGHYECINTIGDIENWRDQLLVYDSNGKFIFSGDGLGILSYDSANNTFLVSDYMNGRLLRYDSEGNILETANTDFVPGDAYDNVCSVWSDTTEEYLLYKGERITPIHTRCTNMLIMDGCEVYEMMSWPDDENEDYSYTAYIIKGDKFPLYDVYEGGWAYPYIDECYTAGIMNGTGNFQFSPNAPVSRAQVVTMLWRLEGEPEPTGEGGIKFTDTDDDTWYSSAVEWAAESGVVNGIGHGMFAPDRTITRGEVAAILYRYADYKGIDTSGTADITTFPDDGDVAQWNRDSLAWCVAEGIITGKSAGAGNPVYLAPTDVLTRAEIAAVLCRFGID